MSILIKINNIVYPCKIYHVNINNEDSAAQCDICQTWVRTECNKLNHIEYKYLQMTQMTPGTIFPVALKFSLL